MNLKLTPMNEEALQVQIENGDYSVSDIVHKELLGVKHVKFAGVAPPHPLIKKLLIQVQTDGETSPDRALEEALQGAQKTVAELLALARQHFPEVRPRLPEEKVSPTEPPPATDSQAGEQATATAANEQETPSPQSDRAA